MVLMTQSPAGFLRRRGPTEGTGRYPRHTRKDMSMNTASQSEIGTRAAPSAGDKPASKQTASQRVAHPLAVVTLVWTGLFMTTLDASIVNIGLPTIARAFGTP